MWDTAQAGCRRATLGLLALALIGALALTAAPAASAGKLKTATNTVSVNGLGASGSARVTCPSGTRAFAGGFRTSIPVFATSGTAQDLLIVNESRRSGATGWRVSAGQLGSGSGSLTAIAYCRSAKLKQVVTTTPLAAAGRSEADATANCPKGTVAVSGGFAIPAVVSQTQFAFVTEDRLRGSRSWLVHGIRSSGAVPAEGTVGSYVYCAKGNKLSTAVDVATLTTTQPSNPLATIASEPCAKGSAPLSAGFKAPLVKSGTARETVFVNELRLTKRGSIVSGQPFGGSGLALSLTAFAYCK